jgi:hypothetical protein
MSTQTPTRPTTKPRRLDLDAPQAEALRRLLRRVGASGAGDAIRVSDADLPSLSMVLFRLTPRREA